MLYFFNLFFTVRLLFPLNAEYPNLPTTSFIEFEFLVISSSSSFEYKSIKAI